MKIIYVHHGNRKKGNPSTQDDDLTEIGYKDCEVVAEILNDDKLKPRVKAIYTSPYFRCRKTAEIINKYLNVDIINDDRLNEYVGSSGETWTDVQCRIIDIIDEIVEKYGDDDVVICVTSGVNVAGFIIKSFGLETSQETPFLWIPSCSPIIFDFKKGK